MTRNQDIVVFGHAAIEARMRGVARDLSDGQCHCRVFPISEDAATWRDSGVLSAIDECKVAVFVFSKEANTSAAVLACVSAVFRKRKPIIPYLLDNAPFSPSSKSPFAPELDYCLGPVEYVDSAKNDALNKLWDGIARILSPVKKSPNPRRWPKWCVAAILVVLAVAAWRFLGPGSRVGFVLSLEPLVEASLDGVCQDYAEEVKRGRLQIVMLDCVTGDYAAFERMFDDGVVKGVTRASARKNAVLQSYSADRLMIPILAATAMRYAGVNRTVAIGRDDWRNCGLSQWNHMLGDRPLEQGLSALHLSTALQGRGVSSDARRYSVTPYHLLQGLLGVVGEAHGCPGFDYCGGSGNAKAVLEKMKYEDGFGLLTGAVLCEAESKITGKERCACNVAGAAGYEDTFCMLFVRLEVETTDEEFDVSDEALNLWRTIGIVAKAADAKWGGNGR